MINTPGLASGGVSLKESKERAMEILAKRQENWMLEVRRILPSHCSSFYVYLLVYLSIYF